MRKAQIQKTSGMLCAVVLGCLGISQGALGQRSFPMEASISDLREAIDSGRLSSSALVDFYLKRIHAYDHSGPIAQ
jgi:hypothetical protein